MAWDERIRIDNQLWNDFCLYASGGANGGINESITGGDSEETEHFKIKEIRLHFSVAFASVEDFKIRLSSINGSVHNIVLYSYAVNGSTDIIYRPPISDALLFVSGDHLVFTMSMKSATNIWGLNVQGWAIAS